MQFLRTLFWVVLAVAAVVFAMHNWTPVTVSLWNGLLIEAKLPVLIAIAFLIGFLPTFIVHKIARWQWRKRIDAHERALADLRAVEPLPAPETNPPEPDPVMLDKPAQTALAS